MLTTFLQAIFKNKLFVIFTAFWSLYFIVFWSQALTVDENGNVVAGLVNIWGDWAAHFTMGSAMAERGLFLSTSPFLITAPFSYPFAANLISAVLIRMQVDFFQAFVIPSLVFSIACVVLLFKFYQQVFRSAKVALVGSLIFLFNGGLGIYYFFQDLVSSDQPWDVLLNPPQTYTNIESELIRWISVIDSQIIPQRAFTMGFPLALLGLILVHKLLMMKKSGNANPSSAKAMLWPVLIFGLMPIIHTHSFLAGLIIMATWMLTDITSLKNLKKWLAFALLTGLIAGPLILTYFFGNASSGFLKWHPGWYAFSHDIGWGEFWLINWGITPLMGLIGLGMVIKNSKKSDRIKTLITFAPFWVIFILINLFLFQPFIWDNTKLLTWAAVGIAGLAGYAVVELWNKKLAPLVKPLAMAGLILIFLSMISAGAIDAWRVLRVEAHSYRMYSAEDLGLADWVKENTPADSIWLTGDQHNNWLFNLTGRQSILTYKGWLWTHGYDYLTEDRDVSVMYLQPAASSSIYEQYGVDYVLVGPNEIEVWNANLTELDQQFEMVKLTDNYQIFKTH